MAPVFTLASLLDSKTLTLCSSCEKMLSTDFTRMLGGPQPGKPREEGQMWLGPAMLDLGFTLPSRWPGACGQGLSKG